MSEDHGRISDYQNYKQQYEDWIWETLFEVLYLFIKRELNLPGKYFGFLVYWSYVCYMYIGNQHFLNSFGTTLFSLALQEK